MKEPRGVSEGRVGLVVAWLDMSGGDSVGRFGGEASAFLTGDLGKTRRGERRGVRDLRRAGSAASSMALSRLSRLCSFSVRPCSYSVVVRV